jgi:hypothetical protein
MVLVEALQPQQITGGMGAGQPHGAQPGALINGPGDHLPEREFSLAAIAQSIHDSELLGQIVQDGHSANRKALPKGKGRHPLTL